MSNNQAIMLSKTQNVFQRTIPKVVIGLSAATITPIIATLILVPLFMIIADFGCKDNGCVGVAGSLVLGIWSGMCATPIVIFHVIAFGLPATIIGIYLKQIHWWTCTIVGFVIGCIPASIYMFTQLSFNGNFASLTYPHLRVLILGLSIPLFVGLCGAVGGISFWIVWRISPPFESLETSNNRVS